MFTMTTDRCTRDEFLGRVQIQARLGSRHQAERSTRAVLSAVRDSLVPCASRLAEDLPAEIGQPLRRLEELEIRTDRIGLLEFLDRVTRRGAIPQKDAAEQTKAVLDVLQEVVTPESFSFLRAKVPRDLRVLLDGFPRVTAGWDV